MNRQCCGQYFPRRNLSLIIHYTERIILHADVLGGVRDGENNCVSSCTKYYHHSPFVSCKWRRSVYERTPRRRCDLQTGWSTAAAAAAVLYQRTGGNSGRTRRPRACVADRRRLALACLSPTARHRRHLTGRPATRTTAFHHEGAISLQIFT